jgi:hypothetical protein
MVLGYGKEIRKVSAKLQTAFKISNNNSILKTIETQKKSCNKIYLNRLNIATNIAIKIMAKPSGNTRC